MGNCANKPLTKEEGAAAPEEKPAETTAVEREIAVAENKVMSSTTADADHPAKPQLSLAQMLEDEGKNPITEEATKLVEPITKEAETKKEETHKPAATAEPAKTEPAKKEETKPAEVSTNAAPQKPEELIEKIKVEDKKPEPTK